ncbi:MAG: redoxin domain-containing protein [Kineosporiaceae bacterium]
MTPSPRSRPLAMAALAAVALAVGACGAGDSADEPAEEVMTEEAMTEEPMTEEAMTEEAMTDEAAGAGSGSIAAVDDVLGAAAAPVGYDAAAVTTDTVDGGSFAAADVSGPVVYWFWAPWCTICRSEAPEVADVAAEYEGQVTFVGVAGLGPVADMRDFVADTGVEGFAHAVDPDGSVWTGFEVFSQPSYVFVDAAGEARTWTGGLDGNTLREATAALAG